MRKDLSPEIPNYPELATIANPELRGICIQSGQELSGILAEVNAFPSLIEVPQHTPLVTQEKVDATLSRVLGEHFGSLQTAHSAYAQTNADLVPNSGFSPKSLNDLALAKLSSKTYDRSMNRRMYQTDLNTNYALVIRAVSVVPKFTAEDVEEIRRATVLPMREFTSDFNTATDAHYPSKIDQINNIIAARNRLDPNLDLTTAKLTVLAGIYSCIKSPEILSVYNKAKIAHEYPDTEDKVMYHATRIIGDIHAKNGGAADKLYILKNYHSTGRLLGIPSRSFRETHKVLSSLISTYESLVWADGVISDMSQRDSKFLTRRAKAVNTAADNLANRGLQTLEEFQGKIINLHNQRVRSPENNGSDSYDGIREETLGAELLVIKHAVSIAEGFDRLNIRINTKLRNRLEVLSGPTIHGQFQSLEQSRAKASRMEAAKDLIKEFEAIDDQYILSNKKLRERCPGSPMLARQLSESISTAQPLPENDARALVALMTGAYWERTGEATPLDAVTRQYLHDAQRLRELSADLLALDQPQTSKLLKSINLLDELIDSGLFDDNSKKTMFKVYDEFLLEYLVARDGYDQTLEPMVQPEVQDNIPNEATTDFGNDIPVETFRQAQEEDIRVFPPGANAEEIKADFLKQTDESDIPNIEWERITRLIELRNHCNAKLLDTKLIRTKHASWQVLPFFILEVKIPQDAHAVAIVESPVYGNATYIYREAEDRLPWRDVVQLTRQDARELGATSAVHVDSNRLDLHFKKVWDRLLSELTVNR